MTLDESIKRYTNNAEYERTHGNLQGCLEFRQLAEWLSELKQLRERTKWIPISDHNPERTDAYEILGRCFYFGDNTWARDVGIVAWREFTCRNRIIGGDDLWELR